MTSPEPSVEWDGVVEIAVEGTDTTDTPDQPDQPTGDDAGGAA